MAIQLWHRPWALLDGTGTRYTMLDEVTLPLSRPGAGPIWLFTDTEDGPVVGGKKGIGIREGEPVGGHGIFAMPVPLRGSDGMHVQTHVGSVRLEFSSIPDRPLEDLEPETEDQVMAKALLDRVKSVWARLREVESALADPARIWEHLVKSWLADAAAANPEMDIIVDQARRLFPTLDLLDRAPRRTLRRTRRMIPLSRVQEIDRRAMTWLIRQPGETMEERGGDRQRIQAVAREENFNTLENRVLLSYAKLARGVARDYRDRHKTAAGHSDRVRLVTGYGARCNRLETNFRALGVFEANADVTPNFVLQNNPNYTKMWDAWRELLKRRRILDELWRWQARSWDEFCALAVIVALQSIPGAQSVAVSPLVFADEQKQGCWISHVNPMAVFFLPDARVTIEVSYRFRGGAILSKFGAPIWLRLGRVNSADFLSRWAVWPVWDAVGGLEHGETEEISALLPNGRNESVKGGITIRPTADGQNAEVRSLANVGCLTLGASGPGLKAGIEQLRDFLIHHVLAQAS